MATSQKLVITNPKRLSAFQVGRERWFPYYAGFSSQFASKLVASSSLPKGSVVMDPWNGSGTTTACAVENGYKAVGFDLNPPMAVVGKARLLPHSELASVTPLLADILRKAALSRRPWVEGEPLSIWFSPEAAMAIRRIERAIYGLLISENDNKSAVDSAEGMSCTAAFFYVALFRAVRSLLLKFRVSNPTWMGRPRTASSRVRPGCLTVRECFAASVVEMVLHSSAPTTNGTGRRADFRLAVASSENLPVGRREVDFVLSSPPYCTRIDYAVATSPELAVLGFRVESRLRELRTGLIGTPTIHKEISDPAMSWGATCLALLRRIRNHPSKAAKTYYYKTYVQYFAAMSRSFSELGRCLKLQGKCVLVVQDSYFKDLHVNLAGIFAEMADAASLRLHRQVDFPISRTFGSVNSRSRHYRAESSATESVLCFVKNA